MPGSYLPESLKKRIPLLIAVVLTAAFFILGFKNRDLIGPGLLTRLDFLVMDQKFKLRGFQPPGNQVVLVAFDDRTLDRYGTFHLFERDRIASLIDHLSAAKPKVIGVDITYPDASTAENDQKFADAIQRAGNVVLGIDLPLKSNVAERRQATPLTPELMNLVFAKEVFPAEHVKQSAAQNSNGVIRGENIDEVVQGKGLQMAIPQLIKASASFGFVNFHRDAGGTLHYQPQFIEYQGRLWPSLDIEVARLYLNARSPVMEISHGNITQVQIGQYALQTDKFGRYMLNFDGPRRWHQTISMVDVMDGKVAPEVFKDKIVIIGSPAIGLTDIVASPFDSNLPAMDLHANVIDNFIHQEYLYRTELAKVIDLALIVVFGLISAIYLPRMNTTRSVFYLCFLFALFATLNILSFLLAHWVLSFVYPGLALVVTGSSIISFKYFTEEREKKRTKAIFQHYLHPNVVDQVMTQPAMLKLGGEKRELTVLFSNIRGFTSFSEKMAPTEVVHFLNQYFNKMTAIIFRHKGTLDKLIGDAVMCFWGCPVETKDHAIRGVITALEMIKGVEDLRGVLVLPGGARFEINIGLNTGPMVVGNMGSQSRLFYTVMGDNVSLGSRLESLNKYYGTKIIISDTTFQKVQHMVFCRQLDTIQVKGRSQAVTIYEPLGLKPLKFERRRTDRRGELTLYRKIKRAIVMMQHGERRLGPRRLGSDRIVVTAEHVEIASMYEHGLALYRKGDFDAAEMGFDHVLTLNPGDGPSRLMKSRIAKYRTDHAGGEAHFDPVYKFDEQ